MVPADGQHQVSGAEAAMHDNLSYESVDYPTLGSEEPQSSLGPYQSCYAPNIGIAPKNQEVEAGQELSLSCGASGTEAMYYQWFFNEKPLGERTRCNTVKILKATHQHSGQYYCQVENSKDTVSTAKVVVTVRGTYSNPAVRFLHNLQCIVFQVRSLGLSAFPSLKFECQ